MSAINRKQSQPMQSLPISTPQHDPFFITMGPMTNASSQTYHSGIALAKLCFTAATNNIIQSYNYAGSQSPDSSPKKIERENSHDRIAVLIESNGSRFIRYRLNFDSPRTAEAAAQLGITFEDCMKRYFD